MTAFAMAVPVMSTNPWSQMRRSGAADDIDFEIKGQELQFAGIELDPGESAVAEAGAFVWKDAAIGMTTVFGDGSDAQGGGFMGKLIGAGKRLVTGENPFTTVFTHNGRGKARVAFASPTPGAILPIRLADLGGTLICRKDAFLAAAKGVTIGAQFRRKVLTGLFGGEGFIMQRLDGVRGRRCPRASAECCRGQHSAQTGWVFAQMGGTVVERERRDGEELHVDTGCLAAHTPSVDFDLVTVGGIRTMFSGGEGVFFPRLRGPGRLWIQSLPFSRLAGRMLAAAGSRGGQNRGEGSALGRLGNGIGGNDWSRARPSLLTLTLTLTLPRLRRSLPLPSGEG